MSRIADSNQFDVLSTPSTNEAKSWESTKGGKDDVKQQMHSAREGAKAKAADLQTQVVEGVQSGIAMAKSKLASVTGDSSIKDKSNQELLDDAAEAGSEQWETVKRKGKAQVKQAQEQLDANLTPDQKAKLQKAKQQAKQAGAKLDRKARGLLAPILNLPQLRPVRDFIQSNHLELPVMIFSAILSLWLALTVIRLITTAATPKVPEFDIHSKEATMDWLKYHAGDYKDKVVDAKSSMTAKAAAFLANYKYDKLKSNAIDYKEIGMKKLGLTEPSYAEMLWAYATGRPLTWQGRVESVLHDAKSGINKVDLLHKASGVKDSVKDVLGLREPTLGEKIKYFMTGHHAPTIKEQLAAQAKLQGNGILDGLRNTWNDASGSIRDGVNSGVDSIRAHLPGGQEALEAARLKAYEATHQSTLDKLKSGAEYVKNRIVHGSEEAAHIAEDRAKEAMDKAKLHAGL